MPLWCDLSSERAGGRAVTAHERAQPKPLAVEVWVADGHAERGLVDNMSVDQRRDVAAEVAHVLARLGSLRERADTGNGDVAECVGGGLGEHVARGVAGDLHELAAALGLGVGANGRGAVMAIAIGCSWSEVARMDWQQSWRHLRSDCEVEGSTRFRYRGRLVVVLVGRFGLRYRAGSCQPCPFATSPVGFGQLGQPREVFPRGLLTSSGLRATLSSDTRSTTRCSRAKLGPHVCESTVTRRTQIPSHELIAHFQPRSPERTG